MFLTALLCFILLCFTPFHCPLFFFCLFSVFLPFHFRVHFHWGTIMESCYWARELLNAVPMPRLCIIKSSNSKKARLPLFWNPLLGRKTDYTRFKVFRETKSHQIRTHCTLERFSGSHYTILIDIYASQDVYPNSECFTSLSDCFTNSFYVFNKLTWSNWRAELKNV